MRHPSARLPHRALTLCLVLGAGTYAPLPLLRTEAVAGTSPSGPSAASGSGEKSAHDFTSLRTFTKVLLYVKDNYAVPERIKPKQMLVTALRYVEIVVLDVIVDGNADSARIKVTAGSEAREFDISHVTSLWKLSFVLKEIFQFMSENMRPMEDTRAVEYAAINGMLSTLDPQSILFRPELYSDLKKTIKGVYGSIGIILQLQEGNLIVRTVLPEMPAAKAGLQKGDWITKIGDESMVSMELSEAISKLRGPVGSKIVITVKRKGWDKPRVMTLNRAMISIESVQHKMLAGNVGYVRLKNFQGNTTRDLEAALADIRKQAETQGGTMKGLVLDLRGNSGGLFEQALQVSDVFLSRGTIVTTVGMANKLLKREEKRANPDDGDYVAPMAVLVNAGSASASEIVAGALKNQNRAVIIGRQTFGMGSVQVMYDFPDDAALKLTIARFLTPGDVSIQGVGIAPDIELEPTRVTKDHVDVFAPHKPSSEAAQERSLSEAAEDVRGREQPVERLKYLEKEGKSSEAEGELDAESLEELEEDFEVRFARDFVLKAPSVERSEMLRQGKRYVEQKRGEEEERLRAAIAALGVDWSPGPTPKPPHLAVTLGPGPEQRLRAGDRMELELTVGNQGAEPVKRLRAWTDSTDSRFLDGREFLLGAVNPGEEKSWKVPILVPWNLTSRREAVTVKLQDDSGMLSETVTAELTFLEQPRPVFSFNWQVLDSCEPCNGDGLLQRGETVDVWVDITNTGTGEAAEAFAQIQNRSGPSIFITQGHARLGRLAPGETATARFQLEVRQGYTPDTFELKLAIIDEPLEEMTTGKLILPVRGEALQVEARKAVVRLREETELFVEPEEGARQLARLRKGVVVRQVAKVGEFAKVELDRERFAFVKAQDAKAGARLKPAPVTRNALEPAPVYSPPRILLEGLDPSQGGLVTSEKRFTLSGTIASEHSPLDLYVLVNDRKVFFQTRARHSGGPTQLPFSTVLELEQGLNQVLVVAYEGPDTYSRRTLVIRRGPVSPGGVSPSAGDAG